MLNVLSSGHLVCHTRHTPARKLNCFSMDNPSSDIKANETIVDSEDGDYGHATGNSVFSFR